MKKTENQKYWDELDEMQKSLERTIELEKFKKQKRLQKKMLTKKP